MSRINTRSSVFALGGHVHSDWLVVEVEVAPTHLNKGKRPAKGTKHVPRNWVYDGATVIDLLASARDFNCSSIVDVE
jgi:hypothetical protein